MARSTSVVSTAGPSPTIGIPLDPNRAGSCADRAARATLWLWAHGIYPSPSAVNMRMRGRTRDCLNGEETKARNAVMRDRAISRQRRYGNRPMFGPDPISEEGEA